jgi:hypothetical protein
MNAKSPEDSSFRALQPGTPNVEPLNPDFYIKTFAAFNFNEQGAQFLQIRTEGKINIDQNCGTDFG